MGTDRKGHSRRDHCHHGRLRTRVRRREQGQRLTGYCCKGTQIKELMGIFDPYISAALPHVKLAGDEARTYMDRIIARLDGILDGVQSEEFIELHPRQTFTLTAGTALDMLQVPA